jgi:hypothetical protein
VSESQLSDFVLEKAESESSGPLSGIVKKAAGTARKKKPLRVAFTEDTTASNAYAGIWKHKAGLVPDFAKKQIRIQNHLVASILRARGNMMSMFGHIKKDRFDIGLDVKIKPEFLDHIDSEQMAKIRDRISKFQQILINCGHTEGLKQSERLSLSDYLDQQARNALTFGWFTTDVMYEDVPEEEKDLYPNGKKFHRFRVTDAGTIMRAACDNDDRSDLRAQAIEEMAKIKEISARIDIQKLKQNNYPWIQVINGKPKQAFTENEMLVYSVFTSTDVEHNGYPVSPIDTCISAITTHLSIDSYNKLYFQNGRAAKGMLVLKSNEIDQATLDDIKQQFFASINSVTNSFRVPIFGVAPEDEVVWQPMTSSAGDGEFQFLYDNVSRTILSTFNISPDELPGYGHLSRGTNSQSLSESGNQFKLTAARDTGIRPLIIKFQAFINERLFPIIDPELAQLCVVELSGLDAQSKEQEALRLQQDAPLHMSMDEVLTSVDKSPVGERVGGSFPFNERYQLVLDKMSTVGEIRSEFYRDPAAALDVLQMYKRDPFWLQTLQMIQAANPAAVKAAFANRPYALETFKMLIQDMLEEE